MLKLTSFYARTAPFFCNVNFLNRSEGRQVLWKLMKEDVGIMQSRSLATLHRSKVSVYGHTITPAPSSTLPRPREPSTTCSPTKAKAVLKVPEDVGVMQSGSLRCRKTKFPYNYTITFLSPSLVPANLQPPLSSRPKQSPLQSDRTFSLMEGASGKKKNDAKQFNYSAESMAVWRPSIFLLWLNCYSPSKVQNVHRQRL